MKFLYCLCANDKIFNQRPYVASLIGATSVNQRMRIVPTSLPLNPGEKGQLILEKLT